VKRILASAIMTLATVGVVIVTPASAEVGDSSGSCPAVIEQVVHTRAAELGSRLPWTIVTDPGGYGHATRKGIEVSRETPCDYDLVISVVNHEFMHELQFRMYKPGVMKQDWMERVADCGSRMLGSKVTPYIGDEVCSDADATVARNLIELTTHVAS
jgi:hypothetical protein